MPRKGKQTRGWILKFGTALDRPKREVEVKCLKELEEELQSFVSFGCGFAHLVNESGSGDALQFGVEGELAVVGHAPERGFDFTWLLGDPSLEGWHPFNIGNTETNLPRRWCIPVPLMLAAARHFFLTEERLPGVIWEDDSVAQALVWGETK